MKKTTQSAWYTVAIVLFCAILGGVYGRRVEATTSPGDSESVRASLKQFTSVYSAIEQHYATPVPPSHAIFGPPESNVGAIPGMLHTLDPHSNFFDRKAFARLEQDQQGKYYGVGMSIKALPGPLGRLETFVLSPLPGSPAFRAGLRAGDVILAVDGKSTDGPNAPDDPYDRMSFVANMLRGPKDTVVSVTVQREGVRKPMNFTITRAEIPRKSVQDAFMVAPGIGYVQILQFTDTTNEELTAALQKLDEDHIHGLILDLRDNPGGLLKEAVEVSDHFLKKGQLIVYHYGRSSPMKRYYARHGDQGNQYPIVVLIDHMTASAAEIVTGALQDHDRALVVGQRSFGKGLVQTVYELADNTMGLALTTAHYYTPSGRLIQRSYRHLSLYDYFNPPGDEPTPHSEIRYTDGGRIVYGGGGITPDVYAAEPKFTPTQAILVEHAAFFNFVQHYRATHATLPGDFRITNSLLNQFRQYLAKLKVTLSSKDYTANLDFLRTQLKEQFAQLYWGEKQSAELDIADDPVVQKAIASFPQARALMVHAQEYMAEKSEARQ